jgi:epoxide hydrolase-like predicted phosphatase
MSRRGLLVDWGGVLTTSPFESFATFAAAEGLPEYAMRGCAVGLGLAPDRAGGLRERLFATMRSDHAMHGAVRALRRLGVRTGLLSNSAGSGGYDERAIHELFDVAVISRDVGVRKPDAAIYAIALDRIGLPPAEVVFVDDLRANLRPAEQLGIATVLHRDAATTTAELERLFQIL